MKQSQHISNSVTETKNNNTQKPSYSPTNGIKGLGNRDLLSEIGGGHALSSPIQAKMESSLGADFSAVRLHESSIVEQGGAVAAASGSHVAFAPGKMNFSSRSGLELLGHELSHVASQARGEVSGNGLVQNSTLEHKADMDGIRAATGGLQPVDSLPMGSLSQSSGAIQCKKGKEKEYMPEMNYGTDILKSFDGMEHDKQAEMMCTLYFAGNNGKTSMEPREENGYWDDTEEQALDMLPNKAKYGLMDSLLQRHTDKLADLEMYHQSLLDSGMSTDEAEIRARYSMPSMEYSAPQLVMGMVLQSTDANRNYGLHTDKDGVRRNRKDENGNEYKQMLPYALELLADNGKDRELAARKEKATALTSGSDNANKWGAEHPDIVAELQANVDAQTLEMAKNYQRPRPQQEKKRGLLSRMFKRR